MIVDDDADFRREFCSCFDDCKITQAPDAGTAIKILKENSGIELVILDVKMPGMDGTRALAMIKKIKPGIKVVMLTGNSTKEIAMASLNNRADEYIEKPFDIAETREIISRLLKEKDAEGIPDTGSTDAKIEKVKKFVERNYDKKTGLDEAALEAGLNPKYLSRVFEEKTGVSFSEFRASVMVAKAKQLLETGHSLGRVAEMLAFADEYAFIRAFKSKTGASPGKYLAAIRRKKNRVKK